MLVQTYFQKLRYQNNLSLSMNPPWSIYLVPVAVIATALYGQTDSNLLQSKFSAKEMPVYNRFDFIQYYA
jgi:hypothetical protein